MHDSLNIATPSPNTKHTAHFTVAGEIRFGPLYFTLSVDQHSFGDRIFGSAHLWSRSSNVLAVQEWLTIDYSEGPITTLLLIDLKRRREATVARVIKGFLVPQTFDDPIIVYHKEYAGQGVIEPCTLDMTTIKQWRALA
jgi:hypothetical protein